MKNKIALLLLVLAAFITISSCKKSENSSTAHFTWVYNDTTYTAVTFKGYTSSMASTPIIVASKNLGIGLSPKSVAITVTTFTNGTYTFTSGSTNTLLYVDSNGDENGAISGSINITSSTNNLLSGNFSGIVRNSSGETDTITGNFINTPVEP